VRRLGVIFAVVAWFSVLGVGVVGADVPANNVAFQIGEGGVDIRWDAACSLETYWAVNVVITHASDNSRANGSGYVFDSRTGQDPAESSDMFWAVSLMPGLNSETFHAQVSLECPNGSPDVVIGAYNFTIGRPFGLGRPKRNKRLGTLRLPVSVPGPGVLVLTGNGINPQRLSRSAGKVNMRVRAKGKTLQRLNRTGKVQVKLRVTFTPTDGVAETDTVSVALIKSPH